jgi:hypothetical protein
MDNIPAFECGGGEFHMQGLNIDDAVVPPTTVALPGFRGVVFHATTRLSSAVNLSSTCKARSRPEVLRGVLSRILECITGETTARVRSTARYYRVCLLGAR